MMPETASQGVQFCSLVAKENNEPLIGTAVPFDHLLAIELDPPWPRDAWQAAQVPAGLSAILNRVAGRGIKVRPQALLPDAQRSQRGLKRVLFFQRPAEAFATYFPLEFFLPDTQIIPLIEALLERPDDLVHFNSYRQANTHQRDLLVCTHGSRDICCGKFGYGLYTALQEHPLVISGQVRVWRTSHTGGHRFAPTLIDLPYGHYWGHLDVDILPALLERHGSVEALLPHYRGWSGLSPLEQIAEREIWRAEGWAWLDYHKVGQMLHLDETRDTAVVRLDFYNPHNDQADAYQAHIHSDGTVVTLKSSGDASLAQVKRYRVSELVKA